MTTRDLFQSELWYFSSYFAKLPKTKFFVPSHKKGTSNSLSTIKMLDNIIFLCQSRIFKEWGILNAYKCL